MANLCRFCFFSRIKWKPFGIAFAHEEDGHSQEWIEKLEPMGIKFLTEVTAECSCFVKSKSAKLTARALLAVALGLPIVTTDYMAALYDCKGSLQNEDFESTLPDPLVFLTEVELVPNSRRKTLYMGITFAFWDRDQYSHIEPVIKACGGRAVLHESTTPLTVPSIVDFIEKQAVKATKGHTTPDAAVTNGAIIPVEPFIDDPHNLPAAELLVKVNTATKALGICLKKRADITASIKNISTKNMFRLRPEGPLPELRNPPPNDPITKTKSRTAASRNGSTITDFFAKAATAATAKNKLASQGSQYPRAKASQVRPKIENPFFQIAPIHTVSTAASTRTERAPISSSSSYGRKEMNKKIENVVPKRPITTTTGSNESQSIFTFFTQDGGGLPAPRAEPKSGSSAADTPNTDKEQDQYQDQDSSLEEIREPLAVFKKQTTTTYKRSRSGEPPQDTPLQEATQTATEFKKRKLMHDQAQIERMERERALRVGMAMVETEMPGHAEIEQSLINEHQQQQQQQQQHHAIQKQQQHQEPKIAFKDAVKVVKKEQVDAYVYSQLGGVGQNELSEGEIMGMKNLALVETFELDMVGHRRRRRTEPNYRVEGGSRQIRDLLEVVTEGHWIGRPNFKKFKKVASRQQQRRYSVNGDGDGDGNGNGNGNGDDNDNEVNNDDDDGGNDDDDGGGLRVRASRFSKSTGKNRRRRRCPPSWSSSVSGARNIKLIEVHPHQQRLQSDVDWLRNESKGNNHQQHQHQQHQQQQQQLHSNSDGGGHDHSSIPNQSQSQESVSLFVGGGGGGLSSSEDDDDDDIQMTSFKRSSNGGRTGSGQLVGSMSGSGSGSGSASTVGPSAQKFKITSRAGSSVVPQPTTTTTTTTTSSVSANANSNFSSVVGMRGTAAAAGTKKRGFRNVHVTLESDDYEDDDDDDENDDGLGFKFSRK